MRLAKSANAAPAMAAADTVAVMSSVPGSMENSVQGSVSDMEVLTPMVKFAMKYFRYEGEILMVLVSGCCGHCNRFLLLLQGGSVIWTSQWEGRSTVSPTH